MQVNTLLTSLLLAHGALLLTAVDVQQKMEASHAPNIHFEELGFLTPLAGHVHVAMEVDVSQFVLAQQYILDGVRRYGSLIYRSNGIVD